MGICGIDGVKKSQLKYEMDPGPEVSVRTGPAFSNPDRAGSLLLFNSWAGPGRVTFDFQFSGRTGLIIFLHGPARPGADP